ncbi:DUF2790 domain-containing protein [Pseudomonas sp. MWU13-2105]|uniref:DUF2790 domain-containing protein n=1 Tax=Pseudomonas sp. MWU13-2105 TaxID=2935074 RepID=UPI00200E0B39|nr:DUF2790 domain-containing protein [Pseudomonas sp. MWU13-2105]
MKNVLITLTLIAMSSIASLASAAEQDNPKVEDYRYSTHLDVAKVLATSDTQYCGIGPREMTYEDHQGTVHTLRYQAFGNYCNNEN